ncbi:MAG: hypothetical protein AAF824_25050, partial [Bacteroidota bacterium]
MRNKSIFLNAALASITCLFLILPNAVQSQCIKGDCDTGKGVYSYPNGDLYKGEWRSAKRHGYGTYKMATGDQYEGYWARDAMHGKGVYVYRNGDRYE